MVLLLIPVAILWLSVAIVAQRDLRRPERQVRGGNKRLWRIVALFSPFTYLVFGRKEQ